MRNIRPNLKDYKIGLPLIMNRGCQHIIHALKKITNKPICQRFITYSAMRLCSIQPPEGTTVVKQGHVTIDQFGKVKVTGSTNLHIKPNLDPSDYQKGQGCVHYCVYAEGEGHTVTSCDLHQDEDNCCVTFSCLGTEGNKNLTCHLKIPIKADIDIDLRRGHNDVCITDMESDVLRLNNISGDCRLKSNKFTHVTVDNVCGHITCGGVLQGDINLTTHQSGDIKADRLQGSNVSLKTDSGNIDVQSIYTEKASITTETGNIYIKNCHRKTKVDITKEGNLKIDSLDGNLLAFVVKGDTDVHISRQERVLVRTRQGDIKLRVPVDHVAALDLHADEVTIQDDIALCEAVREMKDGKLKVTGELNGGEEDIPSSINCQGNYSVLHAETNSGKITLKTQDWFSSLNLSSS